MTTDPVRFVNLLRDNKIKVQRVDNPKPGLMMIMYKPKKEFVKESPNTNVVISLYTTASARLKLLEAMEKVHASEGAELLYTDTVPIINYAYISATMIYKRHILFDNFRTPSSINIKQQMAIHYQQDHI
ncbi:MAG TPA: hypothetical protein VJS91_03760 [Nitrososphaeraceae archaeon]|nr:hypothetical protein [Nitrososphaeraceae archaeon]